MGIWKVCVKNQDCPILQIMIVYKLQIVWLSYVIKLFHSQIERKQDMSPEYMFIL